MVASMQKHSVSKRGAGANKAKQKRKVINELFQEGLFKMDTLEKSLDNLK